MCGIFGIIYYGTSPMVLSELNDTKEMIANLLSASQCRGTDASGICVVTRKNKALMLRHNTAGKNLPVLPEYGKIMDQLNYTNNFKYMIGHTRAKTQGTEKKNINNHPIRAGHVIGVHNGAISNDHHLFNIYKSEFGRDGEVDSEIIFKLLDHFMNKKFNNTLIEAVSKTSKAMTGWFSCAFVHALHPNYLTLFGSHSPSVVIYDFCGYNTMAFASTDKILKDAGDSITKFRYPTSKITLESWSGIRINIDNGKILKFKTEEIARTYNKSSVFMD